MRYHFTPMRMAIMKKIASVGENLEKWEPLFIAVGNVNGLAAVEKQFGGFLKN